ncbi:NUDIX domain-containing protein [Neobacillus notoginsengisoli]|uniref:NUDIX domain-containing protein n=1 Tax=Neobacillus notoginsengisoli TaxID=1578198 RepID=A0A417YZH2_9BACI|nr:NUDIX domain-containing protein [Neobacillus notoginsengisoli]RHW43272.1 NUDIX domain-containing protein [Neobacillus notoginsengisoli]
MTTEMIRIFDDNMVCIGQKPREEVHKAGDWHETFHCWFTIGENLLLQKRSPDKKDYPGLFDITSAGHLTVDETIEDGIREVEEELGVKVEFKDLVSLGVLKEEIIFDEMRDREFCHVFLYECKTMPEFILQKEEVESMHTVRLEDAIKLFDGVVREVEVTLVGGREEKQIIGLDSFVGHGSYYFKVLKRIEEIMANRECAQ